MVCHWGWGDFDRTRTTTGWLRHLMEKEDGNGWIGYHDFSGSGIVHLTGGVTALVGCIFIGARKGRFLTDDGQLRAVVPIPGHSVPITFIGGFTLMFGFLAFNAGAEVISFINGIVISFYALDIRNNKAQYFFHISISYS